MYVLVSNRRWNKNICSFLAKKGIEIIFLENKSKLTYEYLRSINPRYIFFPHWSYIIPDEIYENFECVIFHMTDVPFGRGGSPLQNLISRGIYETQISALLCQRELDAGPVYLKMPLSLHGSAEEIYLRASKIMEEMILYIIKNEPKPQEQCGEVVTFVRRTQAEGNISELSNLEQVFDYIRMLDAEEYPKAFLETDYFRFEFTRSALKQDSIVADVKITMKKAGI